MKKLSMFLVVGMGLYGSLLIACGDDDDEVTCTEDADCVAGCEEAESTCLDGVCDGCTKKTLECTAEGTECADGCEEGDAATCNADTLICDGCTVKTGDGAADDDDDDDAAGCATDADCEATPETPKCEIPADAEEGATGTCVAAADPFSCEGKDEDAECGVEGNMGACAAGACMGSTSKEVTIKKAGATGGDCLVWGDEGPGTDTYKYNGNAMDNSDCILGVSSGDLWWAGPAAADLKIDTKAIGGDASKLNEAATDAQHVAEWGGKEYNFESSHSGDSYTLNFTWSVEVMAAE